MTIPFLRRWLGHREQSIPALALRVPVVSADDPEALFDLGRRCAEGDGATLDHSRAVDCFKKAAVQGHCLAQFNLGLMYGQGRGVLRNEATAILWLRKAAELGNAAAQYHVGVKLYRASKNLRESAEASEHRIEAFKFLRLAVAQGYLAATSALEFVALPMTQQEVDDAERRAVDFLARPGS